MNTARFWRRRHFPQQKSPPHTSHEMRGEDEERTTGSQGRVLLGGEVRNGRVRRKDGFRLLPEPLTLMAALGAGCGVQVGGCIMSGSEAQEGRFAEIARQALAGRVAREMAHEINNLLIGVVTGVEEAMQAGERIVDLRQSLQLASEWGRKIVELVQAFQAAFPERSTSGGPSDLAKALDRVLLLCRQRAQHRGVELKRCYGHLPGVQADARPIEPLFVELLWSTLDSMRVGGKLEVAARQVGDFVAVTVSDPQGGAAPPDIGKAFVALDDPGAAEDGGADPSAAGDVGSGGTLALARSMVRQCGGQLTAETTVGSGCRFTVLLPLAPGRNGT